METGGHKLHQILGQVVREKGSIVLLVFMIWNVLLPSTLKYLQRWFPVGKRSVETILGSFVDELRVPDITIALQAGVITQFTRLLLFYLILKLI